MHVFQQPHKIFKLHLTYICISHSANSARLLNKIFFKCLKESRIYSLSNLDAELTSTTYSPRHEFANRDLFTQIRIYRVYIDDRYHHPSDQYVRQKKQLMLIKGYKPATCW